MLPVGGLAALPLVCWWALWVAAGAGALSVVALRRLWQPSWRGPGVRFRGARCRGFLLVPAMPGGRGKFLRRDSPSSWAVRGRLPPVAWLSLLWCSTRLLFPTPPLNSPAHRSRRQPQHHLATSSHSLSPERKTTLETPADPLPPLPGAQQSCGWFQWRWLPGAVPARRYAKAVPLLPPTPWAVGFVQNPSSACPTIRPQSETTHYGVFGGLIRLTSHIWPAWGHCTTRRFHGPNLEGTCPPAL